MARGNARQRIFLDERDYQRMRDGLAQAVARCGWEVLSFVMMPNHLHLFLRTPRPNLSRGMQFLLSGYANWHSKRHGLPGHLFQGRFKGELVEDGSYFWAVSRYIHLNPLRGKRPLVAHPRDWPWSSYPGYARRNQRVDWVSYEVVHATWQGEMGGSDPEAAYRRFVEEGLIQPPENPFREAAYGWLLGSEEFVERMRREMKSPAHPDQVPSARRLMDLPAQSVIAAVAEYYGLSVDALARRRSGAVGRDVAAWLARRLTTATLRELAGAFGLSHPDMSATSPGAPNAPSASPPPSARISKRSRNGSAQPKTGSDPN
jgi:REP element-mobilizing transposase RayT